MLFISRRVGQGQYGVVDTDDGLEEVVDYERLKEAVVCGIDVKGVAVGSRLPWDKNSEIDILTIDVYNNRDVSSVMQTKLQVLKGIEVVVYDDTVVSVTWDRHRVKPGTSIRLSDFASKLGDLIFLSASRGPNSPITVVLDDTLSYSELSLRFVTGTEVRLDIREVKNKETVAMIYAEHRKRGDSKRLDDYVLDTPERLDFWRGVYAVEIGKDPLAGPFLSSTRIEIENEFRSAFVGVWRSSKSIEPAIQDVAFAKRYSYELSKDRAFWMHPLDDYGEIYARDDNILNTFGALTTCNQVQAKFFSNYIFFFTPSSEYKKMYVEICQNFCKWLIEYAKGQGWI